MPITVFRTVAEMQEWSYLRRAEGRIIGCFPTMGALHEGHLNCVRLCAADCDETIVTIFVNPLQFGPGEDFEKYPRDEEADVKLSEDAGATVIYSPGFEEMYHDDSSVYVVENEMSTVMCGRSRPGHFRGVLTVVSKLINACVPHRIYFSRKDYQQLKLIKRMVRDLDFASDVIECPIVREKDGLAMSTRNKYLSETQRQDALCLQNGLTAAINAFGSGERDPRAIEEICHNVITGVASARTDYVECRDSETLSDISEIVNPAVLALAVYIGDTRLIDNDILDPRPEDIS